MLSIYYSKVYVISMQSMMTNCTGSTDNEDKYPIVLSRFCFEYKNIVNSWRLWVPNWNKQFVFFKSYCLSGINQQVIRQSFGLVSIRTIMLDTCGETEMVLLIIITNGLKT